MLRILHWLRVVSSELTRRKVVRVVIAYLMAAAAVVGVVADAGPAWNLPDNAVRLLVVLLAAGLPVAAFLAWAYELVPDPGPDARIGDSAAGQRAEDVPENGVDGSDASAPAGRPEEMAGRLPDRLPSPGTPFIGRSEELSALARLLADDTCRLITVTGPGGAGKTRLALRAAEEAGSRFPDGCAFVELAGLPGAELLPFAIAESLGVTLSRRAEPLADLLDLFREKQLLLVLDNFEHLAAGADILDEILRAAPGVHILATSRERLNLAAETLVPLGGLRLDRGPDEEGDALRLFVTAARRQDVHFQLDAGSQRCAERLCGLLAGNPLAIELAAAWTRVLTCAEILAEVQRDLDILASESPTAPERHRSLRATFDASWRLLSEQERAALTRLSVFQAPFERDAAAVVAEADLPQLRHLVDKSFLTRAENGFLMLDVVRQYALQRLDANPVDAQTTRKRHLSWFVDVLHSLEQRLMRSEPSAVTRVAQAMADVRAAWAFACETQDVSALAVGMDGLFCFYEARGWSREGVAAFGRAVDALDDAAQAGKPLARSVLGRLQVRRGALLDRLGEFNEAGVLVKQGLQQAEQLDDGGEVAFALDRLGMIFRAAGAYDQATECHARARDLFDRLNDRHGLGWALAHLGNTALAKGEHDTAASFYTDSLRILREEDDRNGMCVALNNLGYIAIRRKQYDVARRNMGEALSLQAVLGNHRSAAYLLNNLGFAAREAGDYEEAARHLQEGLAISERLGYRGMVAASLTGLAELNVRTGELDHAQSLLRRALQIAGDIGDQPVALEALLTLARLRERRGDTGSAVRVARAVAAHPAVSADTRAEADELIARYASTSRTAPTPPAGNLQDFVADALAADPVADTGPRARPAAPRAHGRVGASIEPG